MPPANQTPDERLATDIARIACFTNGGLCLRSTGLASGSRAIGRNARLLRRPMIGEDLDGVHPQQENAGRRRSDYVSGISSHGEPAEPLCPVGFRQFNAT